MGVHDHFLPGATLGIVLGLARPCLGATIALHRDTLARIGGFEAVANQLADDYAIGHGALRAGLRIAIPPMLVSHSFEEKSLGEVVLHELRWARTIFTVDPIGYVGSSVTHVLPWSLIAAALRGFDALGLAAVFVALACRLLLKGWLAREFELPKADYALTPVHDILSFAIFFVCFWSPRARWRGRDFIVSRDGAMAAAK
jgi:ceramide glucosyltransferase